MDHSVQILSLPSGLDVNVQIQETGPPILLVHGFPLDHTMWHMQVGRLGRHCRMIAPDLRGFGRSHDLGRKPTLEAADETDFAVGSSAMVMTMEQYADDLAAVLEAANVTEPVTLIGLSMGGYIAWQFWRRHRDRLHSLVLCDTRAAADSEETRKGRLENAERVLREGTEFLVEQMLPKVMSSYSRARQPLLTAEVRRAMVKATPAGVAAALLGMAQRPDMTAELSKIDVPTLVLVGSDDIISPPDEMRGIAEKIPGAIFEIIPKAGHLAPLESPTAANHAIEVFLKKIGRIPK